MRFYNPETVSNTAYAYDPVAQTQTVAYGAATAINTYPSVGGQAISYIDGYSQGRGLHSAGNLHHAGDGWWRYYNTNGQLIREAGNALGSQTHLYDALGERYWSQHWDNATTATSFVPSSDGLRPETVRELDYVWVQAQGNWSRTTDRTYVLGPLPDERLIWMEGRGANRQVSYPHTDRRGSTIALSRGGQAVNTYAYDEYGQGRAQDGVTGYPFRYTGQRLDPYTGTYHYKAREYSPTLGRFLQPDPARFVDGPNIYAYVGTNPWNAVDPTGLQIEVFWTSPTTANVYFLYAIDNSAGTPAYTAAQINAQISADYTRSGVPYAGGSVDITAFGIQVDINDPAVAAGEASVVSADPSITGSARSHTNGLGGTQVDMRIGDGANIVSHELAHTGGAGDQYPGGTDASGTTIPSTYIQTNSVMGNAQAPANDQTHQ